MKRWWQRRSLKLRLALWYALATAIVITAFAWFIYEVIEHRLAAEIDRQLRIDFDLVEGQLDRDDSGNIRYTLHGSHGDEGFARMFAWFEVWSEDGELLFRHWPVPQSAVRKAPPAPDGATLRFRTIEIERGLFLRVMERPARVLGQGLVLRLFRDESDMRHTLRQIVEVSALGLPIVMLCASLGGYAIARRSLASVGEMARQAQQITSESLSDRLPIPNPYDELGELAAVFNQTLARLEASFAELKRFAADASHELRSPLTALRTVGEVGLRTGVTSDALRETIGSMLEEAERLQEVVEALLVMARLESERSPVLVESIRVDDLLEHVRDHLEVVAAEKQQTLNIAKNIALTVAADGVLLRQALINVVHNAIRYTPERGTISIRAAQESREVSLEVEDNGPGIETQHRERIFERFYRVDKARSRMHGGVGLGLAIAKWSIERQAGRIEVLSAPGAGSIFRICLPASAPLEV